MLLFSLNEFGEVRGGSLACPIQLDSPYGGFYFYAQHLVEIMLTVFGSDIVSISSQKHDGSLTFTASYGSKSARAETITFTHDSFRHEMDDCLTF